MITRPPAAYLIGLDMALSWVHKPSTTIEMPIPHYSIRFGDFRDVLTELPEHKGSVHIITDPPYLGAVNCADVSGFVERGRQRQNNGRGYVMPYHGASRHLLSSLVDYAKSVCTGWFVCFSDMRGAGFLDSRLRIRRAAAIAHVVWVKPKSMAPPRGNNLIPRRSFDNIVVARWFRSKQGGGKKDLTGAYVTPNGGPQDCLITGGKPLYLMKSIIDDYTKPGDLIIDPFCGGGTTVLAAMQMNRLSMSSEVDEETYNMALGRIKQWIGEEAVRMYRINAIKLAGEARRIQARNAQ